MKQHQAKTSNLVFSSDLPPTHDRLHAQTTAQGVELSDQQFQQVFDRVMQLHELKQDVYSQEIHAIVDEIQQCPPESFRLSGIQITLGHSLIPSATVSLVSPDGRQLITEASGNSSIDAIYSAIQQALKVRVFLNDFSYGNLTQGINALGRATVTIEHHGQEVVARAYSTDILEASAKAFLIAINIVLHNRKSNFAI